MKLYTKTATDAQFLGMRAGLRLALALAATHALLGANAFAKETRYKDYPLEIREGDRLVIQGIKGSVKLAPAVDARRAVLRARKSLADKTSNGDSSEKLAAKFESLTFNVRREGGALIIEARGPDTREAWSQWIKAGSPDLALELEVPQMPVEINLHEGQIQINGWRQSLTLGLVSGAIKTAATDGFLKLQIQRGTVNVDRHRGSLQVDSFAAKVNVQELEGDLGLSNFAGDSALTKVKGNLELSSNAGATTIAKSSGAIEFINGHGTWNATGFEGPVKGQTDQGPVNVTVDGEAEVRVESNQGAVAVKLPADSGSLVRMQTDEGSLYPPEAIKSNSAHGKLVNGRLPGGGPKGTVALKSKAGSLRVR